MARPSDEWEHTGTWACNGEYHWRAFSNGKDPHSSKYPNIPQQKREWKAVEGSNSLYCFRAGPGVNAPDINELQVSFLSCFCDECRAGNLANCEALATVRPAFYVQMHQKAGGRARPPMRRTVAAAAATSMLDKTHTRMQVRNASA